MPEENLSDIERSLAGLKPAGIVNRDALIFRAGQASAARSKVWLFAALTMSLAGFALGVASWVREGPTRLVYVEAPRSSASPEDAPRSPAKNATLPEESPRSPTHADSSPLSYLRLQQQALRFGVESLPAADQPQEPMPPLNYSDLSAGDRPRFMAPFSSLLFGVD